MIGYIYLLQEREFIKTKENIYKLGKTKQENLKRIQNYPNGTKLIIQLECENCDINEKNLIIIFKQKFMQRIDIGTEYFEGDKYEMISIIYNVVMDYNKIIETDNKIVETDNKIVETDNKIVETDNKIIESDNKIVETDNKIVKTDNKIVKTDNKIVKTDNKIFKTDILCHICNFTTKNKNEFEKHVRSKQHIDNLENKKNNIDDNTCSKCFKSFSTKGNMNVHELRCLGTLNYNQCEYCFKFFSSTISKSHHRITCKKKPIKRTYQNVIYQKDY